MNTETVLHFERLLLPGGWRRDVRLELEDGLIVSITPDAAPQSGDKRHAIGLPGMPNLHCHGFQRGMAGAAEYRGEGEDSFWTWREAMYRFVDRLDPEAMLAIAALAYMEMLEAGFTRVGEFHYLHHDPSGKTYDDPARMGAALAEAAAETGIALTLLPVFYAQAGFGGLPPSPEQRRFVTDPESFARLLEASRRVLAGLHDARLGIAPHSLRAVTPAALAEVTALERDGPVHIHVAEQQREVDDCLAWSGARPVQWLLDNADVGPDWCLVHATHVNEAEWKGMIRSGAVAGLCPMTEANLGDGIFPAAAALAGGLGFGIGSDSNVRIDMTEELRLLEYGQRLSLRSRNCLTGTRGGSTGRFLYEGAVVGGSQALAAPAPLAPGSPADLVSLRADAPSMIGRSDDGLLDAFIFSAGQGVIESVWRRGCRIVRNGHHVRREAIVGHFAQTMRRLAQ
ncbi:formimidoylglutamate deiminase [Novosphingobium mathurense]|uniref:Formiminoglutamate deiminase n=1 Tax=Novosphingobium mathurense TaxID=428990 RepID=A0A1U6GRX7_9SPHN|nr:formimidoylglutamate deiminase [Novosphingobium mathurense]SLJ86282.1 formiminoglutamate deiminase [Novosphingobium mathurense]